METEENLLEELKPMDAKAIAKLLHSQRLKDHLEVRATALNGAAACFYCCTIHRSLMDVCAGWVGLCRCACVNRKWSGH